MMLEDLSDVPPAISLIIRELSAEDTFADFRKKIINLLPEIRIQSESFLADQSERVSDDDSGHRFEAHLHGALDLFTGRGCGAFSCRLSAAKRLARSMGLISDRIWITDLFSERFLYLDEKNDEEVLELIKDFLVILELLPLIREGIVRFRSPVFPSCSSCHNHFEDQVEFISEAINKQFLSEFKLQSSDEGYGSISIGNCLIPSVIYQVYEEHNSSVNEFGREWIKQEIRSALWSAREASLTRGSVISNSRVGLAGLLQADGRFVNSSNLNLLDDERLFTVPWVSQLTTQQVVELRKEADMALPIFREKIASMMSNSDTNVAIQELREQAEQVRSELKVTQNKSVNYWKTTFGVLGLGLSAYGVAADEVAAGVGGLLPIIQLLIDHKKGDEADVQTLKAKPGYVLMKAQDILAHSDEH